MKIDVLWKYGFIRISKEKQSNLSSNLVQCNNAAKPGAHQNQRTLACDFYTLPSTYIQLSVTYSTSTSSSVHCDCSLFLKICWRFFSQIIKNFLPVQIISSHLKRVQIFLFLIIFFIGSTTFTLALTRPHLFWGSVYSVLTRRFFLFCTSPAMLQ